MKTKAIIFQAPEELKAAATEALADCGVTLSEYLRICLERFLEHKLSSKIKNEIQTTADTVVKEFLI